MTMFLTADPRYVVYAFSNMVPVVCPIDVRETRVEKDGTVIFEDLEGAEKVCWDVQEPELVESELVPGTQVLSAEVRFENDIRTVPVTSCSIVLADGTVHPLLSSEENWLYIQP